MIALLSLLLATSCPDDAPVVSLLRTEAADQVALCDVDGDGDLDLVHLTPAEVRVHRLEERAYAAEPDLTLAWPSENVAWTLADWRGDGRTQLATYVDGRTVASFALDGTERPEDELLRFDFDGRVPRGRFEMRFLRDVNEDGRVDLVLPALGSFAIHLAREDGSFADPIEVRLEADVRVGMGDPNQFSSRFDLSVDVPWFEIRDVDGDGDADLVAETGTLVQFHLAEPELSAAPSWTLDLEALRKELPSDDGVDLANVFGGLSRIVEWRLVDLDGRVPHELLLQVGSTFRVYADAARTGPAGTPQVLKSSGNVLGFSLRDVEGSEQEDLMILRAQDLSVASLLRFLILPGSLDFQLFTYRNEDGVFARRPTRRNTIRLEVPRLLALADELEKIENGAGSEERLPTRRFTSEAGGAEDDVLDLVGSELRVYRDRAPALTADQRPTEEVDGFVELLLLEDGDDLEDGATRTIDLGTLVESSTSEAPTLRAACQEVSPDQRVPLSVASPEAVLRARDLDANGRNDVLVVLRDPDQQAVTLQFVLF